MKNLEKNFIQKYENEGISYWEAFKKERRENIINTLKNPRQWIKGAIFYVSFLGLFGLGLNELGKTDLGKNYNGLVKEVYNIGEQN